MFRILLRAACVAALALGVAGCASMGTVDHDVAAPDSGHTYFVIGIAPPNARVSIFKGFLIGDRFMENPLAATSFYGNPEDGFILGETHGGTMLGVMMVQMAAPGEVVIQPPMVPCGGSRTLVFTAPAGKVVYLTSMRFHYAGNGLAPEYKPDLAEAQAFVAKHYPQLAGKVEQGAFKLMEAGGAGSC